MMNQPKFKTLIRKIIPPNKRQLRLIKSPLKTSLKIWGIFSILGIISLTAAPVIAQDLQQQLGISLNNGTYGMLRNEADLQLRLGIDAEKQGQLEKAISYWSEAGNLYHQSGDLQSLGIVYNYLGITYSKLGQFKEAENALRRRLAIARDQRDFESQIYTLNNLGTIFLRQRNWEAARGSFEQALAVSQGVQNLDGEGLSLSNLGLLAASLKDYPQAIKRYEIAWKLRNQARDFVGTANTLNQLGDVYLTLKQYPEALSMYRFAKAISDENRDISGQSKAFNGMILAYRGWGHPKMALRSLNAWLTLAQEREDLYQQMNANRAGGALHGDLGEFGKARSFYEQAIKLAIALGETQEEAFLRSELSQIIYAHR
jgi:tetratricopeptide (TPR) repeat protein